MQCAACRAASLPTPPHAQILSCVLLRVSATLSATACVCNTVCSCVLLCVCAQATCPAKKGLLAPGMTEEVAVEFCPTQYRYYYDCVRVHCEVRGGGWEGGRVRGWEDGWVGDSMHD